MSLKKKDFTKSLTELLPEGLTEGVVAKIADLVSEKIDETIKLKMGDLTDKVRVFFRTNVDKLKEQAKKELELEDETFRNAQLFNSVKAMLSIETNQADEDHAINTLTESLDKKEDKISVLVTEVDRLVKENLTLKRNTKVLTDQNKKLAESVENLQEVKERNSDKVMSDKAVVVTATNFKISENTTEGAKKTNGNEFLTEGVLAAMKKLSVGKK